MPRVARILALAHRYQALVASGDVKDYADLARLVGVSRPRMTQIMNLLHLAPDIQEAVLDLPAVLTGAEPFWEEDLRPIAGQAVWAKQCATRRGERSRGTRGATARPHLTTGRIRTRPSARPPSSAPPGEDVGRRSRD